MSRFICCCLRLGQSKNQRDSAPSVSMSSPLHDLLQHPQAVDEGLEHQISQWQKAIFDFENSEIQLLMKLPNEAAEILPMLQESPQDFLKHNVEIVRTLAKQRQEVIRIEANLSAKRKAEPKPVAAASAHRPSISAEFETFVGRESGQMGYFTERLSQIWSTRLNDIDPTQGSLSLFRKTESGNNAPGIFVRPKWPDFLTEVSYDVIKVNKYGHQMRRILKLTQNHVVSIKNGVEVTKFYHFLDIRRVGLRRGNRIYVLQRSGKRNLYLSPIAPHILQQLTTRIQVRRSLDRAILGRGHEASPGDGIGGYDVESAAEIIRAIAEANAADADSVMNHFATTLRERTVRTLATDPLAAATTTPPGPEGLSGKEKEEEDGEEEVATMDEEQDLGGEDKGAAGEERGEEEAKENGASLPSCPPPSCSSASSSHLSSLMNEELLADVDLRQTISHVLNDLVQQIEASHDEETDGLSSLPIASPSQSRSKQRTYSSMSDSDRSNTTSGTTPRTPLLITFPENMPEHAIQEAVRKVIFDNSTPEGNTRKVFVDTFRSDVQNATKSPKELMLEVRHFIDGIHEHIVLSRAYSLAILFQQQQQKRMANRLSGVAPASNESAKGRRVTGVGNAGGVLSPLMGEAWQKPSEDQLKFQRRTSLRILRENNLGPSDVDEALLTTISYIVFVVVEEATFLSLKEQLISTVKQNKGYDEESTVVQKLKYFSRRSQQQWGISADHISPLNWSTASFELSSIEHNLTPTYQLQVLTRTVKAIYNEFKHVVLPRLQEKGRGDNVYLGADDLVPIFLYVFCKSNLRHPIRNRDLMWALCHPDQLHGEGGYYLTVYESAIDFVLRENIEAQNFLTPEEERAVEAGSIVERGSDYASFSNFFSGLLKMSGVVEEESSMSMRESFN